MFPFCETLNSALIGKDHIERINSIEPGLCLPSMHKTLGSILRILVARHGGHACDLNMQEIEPGRLGV